MADSTAIEWTDATWNPVTGCTKISAGCDHCYAERFAERFRGVKDHPFEQGFDLTLRPKRLSQPMAWRRPRMIFVNSMSDLFHKARPGRVRRCGVRNHGERRLARVSGSHQAQLSLRAYVNARYADRPAPAHIWMGVSVEDGTKLSRVRHLGDTAARVRFLSLEPLIGPIAQLDLNGIHWAIVGGESGPGARPMHPDWVRQIRKSLRGLRRVPFFFKQWGGLHPQIGRRLLDGESGTSGRTFRLLRSLTGLAA